MTVNNAPHKRFRKDVEGLRAVAVLMVLFYHLDFSWASGGFAGVDVFFVISGFLITGLLVKELNTTGSISLLSFYARRAKRLFPAAILVLLATALMTWAFLPKTRWADIGIDTFASAGYFVNWWLAFRSVDYLAEDVISSPVQHYWSLAVEEQYYLVWPVLVVLALLALRRRLRVMPTLWLVLATVGLLSLTWSIHLTQIEPAQAYFVTTTRMWELAIGGAVALAASWWPRLPATIGVMLAWLGLAMILATLFLLSSDTAWPGYAAALPTLGTAAVIIGGFSGDLRGPASVLGKPLFCWIGALSYSIYLWHWPLIEVSRAQLGELTLLHATTISAGCFLLAWLTWRYIENPVRFSKSVSANPRFSISIGVNLSLAGIVAGLLLYSVALDHSVRPSAPVMGAAVLSDSPRDNPNGLPVDSVDWIFPPPTLAVHDIPDYYNENGCHVGRHDSEPASCIIGNPEGDLTIAIVGDSKIAQWESAIRLLAEKHDWHVILHTKSACGFHSAMLSIDDRPYTECYEWNRKVLERLLGADKPDIVLTSQARSTTAGRRRAGADLTPAIVEWWSQLNAAGIQVIALADNPHPGMVVYECVSENLTNLTACTFPRAAGRGTPALAAAAEQTGNVAFIDMTDWICPTERCAPVIGNVLVYRQGSHVTKTYIESMAPFLEMELGKSGVRLN